MVEPPENRLPSIKINSKSLTDCSPITRTRLGKSKVYNKTHYQRPQKQVSDQKRKSMIGSGSFQCYWSDKKIPIACLGSRVAEGEDVKMMQQHPFVSDND